MKVEIGQQAPAFALRDQHGATVSLASYRGDKAVVLMFYPFAFSRVCTGELCEVVDNLSTFVSDDVQILAVSCDPMFTLRAFAEQEGLTFPLLSDFWPHGEVAGAYGVLNADRGCAERSTFIIDRHGVVRWLVHSRMADPRDLTEQAGVLARLATLRGR
jgi:mycoredoxin-dependent peroxiredoxin